MMSLPLNTNLSFWFFAIIAEQYDLALEMFKENPEFCQEILNILLAKYSYSFSDSELTLENMPPIIPSKQELCQNVTNVLPEARWSAFIENNTSKIGTRDILPIISFDEFIKKSENTIVCITSPLYGDEMKQQLINSGFQEDSIIDYYKL